MNPPSFTEQEIELEVAGMSRKALVRTPPRLSRRPALVIALAVDRHATLNGEWFNIVPNIFLAAGHRVASFDMPYHGELALPDAEGLVAMAQAISRGEDCFTEVRAVGKALIDYCLERGLASEERIVLNGTSRGGLASLHLMAAEPRVLACAVHAPVTDLTTLVEFRAVASHPMTGRMAAAALVPQLVDRPVFITIGTRDPRVSTERCLEFYALLAAGCRKVEPVLFMSEGESHGNTCFPGAGYDAAAAFLLQQCALQSKEPIEGL